MHILESRYMPEGGKKTKQRTHSRWRPKEQKNYFSIFLAPMKVNSQWISSEMSFPQIR